MQIFRKPGVLICSSAFLFALGTYLGTIEVLVWVGNEYELMHIYLPLGFFLWLLALLFLAYGVVSGMRKLRKLQASQRTAFSMVSLIVGVTLGVLALTSTLLPWVIAERVEPLIETRVGTFSVGRYHALTRVNLMMGINKVDEMSLVFVGAMMGILHIPLLSLLEREGPDAMRAFLFSLGGICIIGPVASVYAHRIWWIDLRVDGALGFSVTFESPGPGFLIATLCAIGLIASGIITTVKLARPSTL